MWGEITQEGTIGHVVVDKTTIYKDIISLQKVLVALYTFLPVIMAFLVSKVGMLIRGQERGPSALPVIHHGCTQRSLASRLSLAPQPFPKCLNTDNGFGEHFLATRQGTRSGQDNEASKRVQSTS